MRFRDLSVVASATVLLLAACGGDDTGTATEELPEADAEAAAEDPDVTLELGHVWPEEDPQAQAVQEFADEVEELSGGSVTIQISPAGQLGGDRDILEGLELGTNDLWVGGAGVYNAMTEVGQFYVAPFMFEDVGEAMDAYDGDLGDEITQRIEDETDTRLLSHWPRGPRHLTLGTAAETPDDLQGARIRVPENPMFIKTWQRLGASPTPMEFPEVFTGLQQGTIDGQENPLALVESAGLYQVQSHMILTAHVIEPLAVAIGNAAWDRLSENQQAALVEAADGTAKDNFRSYVENEEQELQEVLAERGMEIVEPDIDAYRERVEGLIEDEFPELEDLYQAATS
jgi:TRAP-type transport system periplasmic protein